MLRYIPKDHPLQRVSPKLLGQMEVAQNGVLARCFRNAGELATRVIDDVKMTIKVPKGLSSQPLSVFTGQSHAELQADARSRERDRAHVAAARTCRYEHAAQRGMRRVLAHECPVLRAPDLRFRTQRVRALVCGFGGSGGAVPSAWTLAQAVRESGLPLAQLLRRGRRLSAVYSFETGLRTALREHHEARNRALAAALSPALTAAFSQCGYRSPSERWCDRAGESVSVAIASGTPALTSSTERVWDSRKSLRTGTSVSRVLYVRPSWHADVAHRTLAVVDSMLTLDAQRCSLSASEAKRASALDNAAVYSAIWVEQGMGMHLKARGGFLAAAQTGNGLVAVHGQTVAGALRTLEQRIRPDVVAARRQSNEERTRARTAAQEAQEASFRAFATELCSCPDGAVLSALLALGAALAAGALDAEVTFGDSRAAGNCATGTRDWMVRHAPGIRAALVRTVLKLALRSGDRVGLALAACRVAVLRWSREQKLDRKAA